LSHSARFSRALTSTFVIEGLCRSMLMVTSRSPFVPFNSCLSPPFSDLVSLMVMPSSPMTARARPATLDTDPSTVEAAPRVVR
jgi:hypothetical protein